ncbi:hypothetical protein M9Y10_030035 [Tritrichomonas musculus]|uniref:Uncharacterized protein n=1 Tax=Tritrichomonas musculus TaxID=1915356 RepID=A0ABR2KNS8_9EUKA
MNLELLTAEVRNDEAHKFTFTRPVQQFMVGFSKFVLQFKPPDHHVKKIIVDLSDCKKNNNEVVVKPNLVLEDTGKKSKPGDMFVNVVVLASVGEGNRNVQMIDGLKINEEKDFPSNFTTVRTALYSTFVQFPNVDHHLQKYSSIIVPYVKETTFSLNGQSMIYDKSSSHCGKVQGSVIMYNKNDSHILCEDFDSRKYRGTGTINFGNPPQGFVPENYQIGCFIHGYELSYETGEDHHLLKIEVSIDVQDNKLFIKDGSVCANISLKAFLTDNGQNKFDIPHNIVSGFVVAFNNKA